MKIKGNIRLLLGKGTYVNAVKPDGYTPLHPAANEDHKEIAELLRKHVAKK